MMTFQNRSLPGTLDRLRYRIALLLSLAYDIELLEHVLIGRSNMDRSGPMPDRRLICERRRLQCLLAFHHFKSFPPLPSPRIHITRRRNIPTAQTYRKTGKSIISQLARKLGWVWRGKREDRTNREPNPAPLINVSGSHDPGNLLLFLRHVRLKVASPPPIAAV